MTFWNRALKIFRSAPVRLRTRQGLEHIGDIDAIGDTSCTIKKADGSIVLVPFIEILVCEPAVAGCE